MRTADQYGAPPPVLAARRPRPAGQVPGRVPGVDSLEDILLQIARCPRQPGCLTGRDGTVRLIKPLTGREDCPGLAFTEATAHGASCPQAARRLLAAGGLSGRALRAGPAGLG